MLVEREATLAALGGAGWASRRSARLDAVGRRPPHELFWVDQEAGKIFCLVDAPDAEAANTVHREAHGLVADSIHPVVEGD